MKNSLKISFVSILIAILMINSSLHGSAATRDWYVATSIKYGYIMSQTESRITEIEGLKEFGSGIEEMELRLDIISIDLVEHEYEANLSTVMGYQGEFGGSTDPEEFSYFLGEEFYYINYKWDEEHSRILLTGFDVEFIYLVFFIEPEWDIFNTNMGNLLDRTQIVDTVTNDFTTYEITLGDFLDTIVSYNIMGISDTVGSLNTVSNSSTQWSFSFDLSNVIYGDKYDSDTNTRSFYPYSKYTVTYTLDFTNGGTLNLFDYHMITEVSLDGIIVENEYKVIFQKGGLEAIDTPFNFSYSLLSLMILPVIIYFMKRKDKRNSGVIRNE